MICSKVFLYDEKTEIWSQIGKLKKARRYHALVALDLSVVCPTGRVVKDKVKKIREAPF